MKKFTFIDLFAGIGGIRLGFERAGGECVFSSEIDKFACQTYQANFGEYPSGDITKIEAKDIPSFDILCAGFPCQPYSNAGKKKGLDDNRGQLLFDIKRIVEYHKPSFVFLENVPSFIRNNKAFYYVINEFGKIGYVLHFQILDSRFFGVPQSRSRCYMTLVRKDITKDEIYVPERSICDTKLSMILENDVSEKYTISDKLWSGHLRRKEANKSLGKGFGFSLYNKNSFWTRTLTARYGKDGSEILIEQEGRNPRKLTPRECARLQGFPESFIIPVSDTQAYKQFGNSVTVPVIEAIAKKIANNF